jgi:nucleotide-binding universal stress UspA family protein
MSTVAQAPVGPSLKNVLFATDFSPCSEAALPYVRALAERYGSTIHMIHVLTPEPMIEIPLDRFPELDADRDVALSAMKTLLGRRPFGKAPYTMTVERGPLWDVLGTFVKTKSIDLIVLGTRGRRGLKKLFLGSVAEEVFRLAPCPVLTVGPLTRHEGAVDAKFATILFATDFSSGSEHAFPYAVSLARANNSHLILLHSVPMSMEITDGGLTNALMRAAKQRVTELLSREDIEELKPEIVVLCGPATDSILSVAKDKQADLIVIGARRASVPSVTSHLPWRTASEVVCNAHCPTLTVRS